MTDLIGTMYFVLLFVTVVLGCRNKFMVLCALWGKRLRRFLGALCFLDECNKCRFGAFWRRKANKISGKMYVLFCIVVFKSIKRGGSYIIHRRLVFRYYTYTISL